MSEIPAVLQRVVSLGYVREHVQPIIMSSQGQAKFSIQAQKNEAVIVFGLRFMDLPRGGVSVTIEHDGKSSAPLPMRSSIAGVWILRGGSALNVNLQNAVVSPFNGVALVDYLYFPQGAAQQALASLLGTDAPAGKTASVWPGGL